MSSGYINLYFGNDVAPELSAFEKLLGPIGLRLEKPGTKHVLALSPTGDQLLATREYVVSQLSAKRDVSIQWWYSNSEDVYCRFSTSASSEQWRVEFGLDGVDADKAELLIRAIVEFFKERCTRGDATAVVVDRTGELEETDWERIVGGYEPLQAVPDILALPRGISTPGFDAMREEMSECPDHAILKGPRAARTFLAN